MAILSKEARRMLDEAGLTETKICLSNGLNEDNINSLIKQGACFDSIGAGDNISASKERVDGVYKLASIKRGLAEQPKIKLSSDTVKTTNPGYKKVYRFYDKKTGYALGDVIALASEKISKDKYTLVSPTEEWKKITLDNYELRELQVPIFKNGQLVYERPNVHEIRNYCIEQFKTIYPEIKRHENPHIYYVDLSIQLLKLKKEMILNYQPDYLDQNKEKIKK